MLSLLGFDTAFDNGLDSLFNSFSDVSLSYQWPLLLLPLPLLIYFFIKPNRKQHKGLATPFHARLASIVGSGEKLHERKTPPLLKLIWLSLVWILLVLAVCQPISTGEAIPQQDNARDMIVAVDISGSMEETDMVVSGQYVDRLTAVKLVVS